MPEAAHEWTVESLNALNGALERRVVERTAQLEVAVSNLHAQVSQRKQAEAALRESEERYRRLVELSPESIVVVGRDRVLYVNDAGVRLLGAADPAELLASHPLNLVHPSARSRASAGLRNLSRSGGVAMQAEMRLVRLDGSAVEAEITAAAVTFDGRPAVQVLVRDVSERRAVERLKDELLSVVSHELQTPLTSIRGSLGLLASGVLGSLPGHGQRMLDIAVTNADRLIRLLNDVLDLERMRAGRLTLRPRAHAASEIVDQAVAEMGGFAERAGVRLVVGQVDGSVDADGDRIVQVLTNLVSNSVKFSPRGSQVCISATDAGQHVRFSVTDAGRGIPADKLDTIFERFQQLDASDSRAKGGTGLGLAICKTIVQQHGGRVWAESTLGQGSTLYVELRSAAQPAVAA